MYIFYVVYTIRTTVWEGLAIHNMGVYQVSKISADLECSESCYPGCVFTNHSQEHSLSFSQRICQFECNTTSDWLNRMV